MESTHQKVNAKSKIVNISFDSQRMHLHLSNEFILSIPFQNYTKLKNASQEQLSKYELWNDGQWVHWEDLDEDLGLDAFISLLK